jgi:hypothetical protein
VEGMVGYVVRRGENGDQQGMSGRGAPGERIGASTMIQRIPRVVRSSRGPIETDNHNAMWPKPPPKPPPDAKAIFLRWLGAASAGDRIATFPQC